MNYPMCELIVDGRGGISDPSDAIDPFEHVVKLEEASGWPIFEEVTTVTTTTVTTTRRVITLRKEKPM